MQGAQAVRRDSSALNCSRDQWSFETTATPGVMQCSPGAITVLYATTFLFKLLSIFNAAGLSTLIHRVDAMKLLFISQTRQRRCCEPCWEWLYIRKEEGFSVALNHFLNGIKKKEQTGVKFTYYCRIYGPVPNIVRQSTTGKHVQHTDRHFFLYIINFVQIYIGKKFIEVVFHILFLWTHTYAMHVLFEADTYTDIHTHRSQRLLLCSRQSEILYLMKKVHAVVQSPSVCCLCHKTEAAVKRSSSVQYNQCFESIVQYSICCT